LAYLKRKNDNISKDNIKTGLTETVLQDVNWIQLIEGRAQWLVFVNTVMNLRVT